MSIVDAKSALVAAVAAITPADVYYGRPASIGRAGAVSIMGGRAAVTPEFIGPSPDADRWTVEAVCSSANLGGAPSDSEAAAMALVGHVRDAIAADTTLGGAVQHCQVLGIDLAPAESDAFASDATVSIQFYMVR